MDLLRVDMGKRKADVVPVPPLYEHLGGRSLIARVLLEEVPPACDALGPNNKLIIAPGLLGGSGVTTSGRLSIGAKSPLTHGVKEANAGGSAGNNLGKRGLKAIIVEGRPQDKKLYLLRISDQGIELLEAEDLRGLGTYQTSVKLQQQFGEGCSVISIGQAGEFLLTGAGIACTGDGDQRSNHAARGGLGAVMGSKGLKAVVIDKAPKAEIPLADKDLFKTASKRFSTEIIENPKLGPQGGSHLYGTASITAAVNTMGALPTRNFSSGNFEEGSTLYGEHLRETILARGGKIGTRCMAGCVIGCRNNYVDLKGEEIVGTLQFETIALLGSNLGLSSLDDVARLNFMCNDFGLDTIETGAALGVAIEAGLASFGDFESIVALLQQVGDGTVLGKVIGNGAAVTGRVLGIQRVPTAMGQAMPGYDPRSLKGNGVTYCTSPQGADHTAGNAFGARNQVNPLGTEEQKELSFKLQLISAVLDSTGLCLFARPPIINDPQLMVDMLNGIYGWDWNEEDLDQANRELLRMELEFNRLAGITPADSRIPEYMCQEPLPPHNSVFDVPDTELADIFKDL
jgi:aldehyde:ferredoxin oxidoreductase